MLHIFEHTLIESLQLLPFLFFTFVIIELIEHKYSRKAKSLIEKSGKYGPFFGSFLGIIPQCGFSVVATNLYITRVISLGTLFAIYLSTSDEMLPILISKNIDIKVIIFIVLIKIIVAILFGFIIDYIFISDVNKHKLNYEVCEDEHCDCNHSIFKSSLKHTIKIFVFLFMVSFLINILFEYFNDSLITKIFVKNKLFGPFFGSIIGLIPNCGASVLLTELFASEVISFSTLLSGLLTGSGVALLVLFKSNKNIKENVSIFILLYFIGVFVGIFFEFIKFLI